MLAGPVGFDVATDAEGTNTGWLTQGLSLHRIDLATGALGEGRVIAGLETPLRDLTFMP